MDGRAKPPKGKADATRPLAGKPPKDEGAKVRDFERRLAERAWNGRKRQARFCKRRIAH
jgi:hypothetical protein